jgi:nucleotide-binding universal stress UspA family protein
VTAVRAKVVVVAHDGTTSSDKAFDEAVAIGARDTARVILLFVVFSGEVETHTRVERIAGVDAELGQHLKQRAAALGVPIEVDIAEGIPATTIAVEAARLGADLIVMGHRQRDLWHRCTEASVAKRVIDKAPCEVLIVP